MFLLRIIKNYNYYEDSKIFAIVEDIEDAKKFAKQIKNFKFNLDIDKSEDLYILGSFNSDDIDIYEEIKLNGHIIPLSNFSYDKNTELTIELEKITNISQKADEEILYGTTIVDAYSVDNRDLKKYIYDREKVYTFTKNYLETKGYEVERFYRNSEDGEAICYKIKNSSEWHFLTHLDPTFIEEILKETDENKKKQEIDSYISC